ADVIRRLGGFFLQVLEGLADLTGYDGGDCAERVAEILERLANGFTDRAEEGFLALALAGLLGRDGLSRLAQGFLVDLSGMLLDVPGDLLLDRLLGFLELFLDLLLPALLLEEFLLPLDALLELGLGLEHFIKL